MAQRKKQHFIPAGYLSAWCDPDTPQGQEPYLWLFESRSRDGRAKAPRNIFSESDFYTETASAGTRDLSLEDFLGRLESRFADLMRAKIEPRKELDAAQHSLLCVFCAAMHARTRAMREHTREQWSYILETGERIEQWAQTASPEQLNALRPVFPPSSAQESSMTIDDVRRVVNLPAQTAVRQMVRVESPILARMDMAILCTADDLGFITSDDPCLWCDPALATAPPALQSPALGSRTVEITLPLSPRRLLLLNWRGVRGYRDVPQGIVDKLNGMRHSQCEAHYVVRRNQVRESWFFEATSCS